MWSIVCIGVVTECYARLRRFNPQVLLTDHLALVTDLWWLAVCAMLFIGFMLWRVPQEEAKLVEVFVRSRWPGVGPLKG